MGGGREENNLATRQKVTTSTKRKTAYTTELFTTEAAHAVHHFYLCVARAAGISPFQEYQYSAA